MAKKLIGSSGSGRFDRKRPAGSAPEQPEPAASDSGLDLNTELDPDSGLDLNTELGLDPALLPPSDQDLPLSVSGEAETDPSPAEAPRKKRKENKEKKVKKEKKEKKKRSPLKITAVLLAVLLFIELAYCLVIFTDLIPPIARLRSIYIETAMSTMRHQWLAKALIPGDIVQAVVDGINQAKAEQVGVNSGWEDVTEPPPVETKSPSSGFSTDAAAEILSLLAQDIGLTNEVDEFFELFYELDEQTTMAYVSAHPEVVSGGWENFLVNEAGLDDSGTTIMTKQGDQVLAIDAANGLLVIRITGSTYRGVLVIGKDPSRLMCANSKYMNSNGQRVGDIAKNNNGLVAITASGFDDGEGVPEGAVIAGGAMSNGVARGTHYPWGYKRIELHLDNRLYITDAHRGYSNSCTDASEWTPALIVDGKIVVTSADGYTALNPRACLGQTRDESILMLGIEGRRLDSLGCDANECANILARYGAYQAMNVDGGTSAIVWYQGEYIMRCSNEDLPEGRRVPNAWVYCTDTVPDP